MKPIYILALFPILFFCLNKAEAQVSAGILRLSSDTFAAIGTDPDQKMFGEARISTGRRVGVEGTFGYNFVQREAVNFYSGFHLGTRPSDDLYLGVPLGLFIKPFSGAREFGFNLEASPIFPTGYGSYFRAGIGLKYVFR